MCSAKRCNSRTILNCSNAGARQDRQVWFHAHVKKPVGWCLRNPVLAQKKEPISRTEDAATMPSFMISDGQAWRREHERVVAAVAVPLATARCAATALAVANVTSVGKDWLDMVSGLRPLL